MAHLGVTYANSELVKHHGTVHDDFPIPSSYKIVDSEVVSAALENSGAAFCDLYGNVLEKAKTEVEMLEEMNSVELLFFLSGMNVQKFNEELQQSIPYFLGESPNPSYDANPLGKELRQLLFSAAAKCERLEDAIEEGNDELFSRILNDTQRRLQYEQMQDAGYEHMQRMMQQEMEGGQPPVQEGVETPPLPPIEGRAASDYVPPQEDGAVAPVQPMQREERLPVPEIQSDNTLAPVELVQQDGAQEFENMPQNQRERMLGNAPVQIDPQADRAVIETALGARDFDNHVRPEDFVEPLAPVSRMDPIEPVRPIRPFIPPPDEF